MCETCVAESALAMTSCRKNSCASLQHGYEIRWDDGPDLTREQLDPEGAARTKKFRLPKGLRKKVRGKLANRCNIAKPMLFVRARGAGAEAKAAEYQIRLPYELWPKMWTATQDLAGSMSLYGLGVKWECVPKAVQNWILRKRKIPRERELRALITKRRAAFNKKRTPKKSGPPTVRIPVKVNGRFEFKVVTPQEYKARQVEQKKKFKKWRSSAQAKRERQHRKDLISEQRIAWRP